MEKYLHPLHIVFQLDLCSSGVAVAAIYFDFAPKCFNKTSKTASTAPVTVPKGPDMNVIHLGLSSLGSQSLYSKFFHS